MKHLLFAAALLSAMTSLACDPAFDGPYHKRNDPIEANPPSYSWEVRAPDELPGTLVIVTASGGGLRAAALTLGVLRGMRNVEIKDKGTLADQIDVISSVSGGSVTAAYLALNGAGNLDDFKGRFIDAPNMWEQLDIVFRPDQLLRLSSPLTQRVDILIDHLEKLYGKKTFGDLAGQRRRPYLILNGADLAEGSTFAFTQPNMDLLCSDLSKMGIATAVAASASFPVAYTPVTLRNYNSPRNPAPHAVCPPNSAIRSGVSAAYAYSDPPEARRQNIATAYARGTKDFVHIIDGGVADNLGISEPYRLLTRNDASPSFRKQIAEGQIRQIIVVSANARGQGDTAKLDHTEGSPGVFEILGKTVGGIRGGAANATVDGFRILLTDRLRAMALNAPTPQQAANFRHVADNTASSPSISKRFRTRP